MSSTVPVKWFPGWPLKTFELPAFLKKCYLLKHSLFTGNAAFLVVQILSNESLNLTHIGKALHWVFLLIPHYSLASGVNDNYMQYSFNKICKNILGLCMKQGIPLEICIESMKNPQLESICKGENILHILLSVKKIKLERIFTYIF